MGSFTGITTATSALVSVTRLLDVTNHNVANSATPGFSRQRADLQQQVALGRGIGVEMIGTDRLRNKYLDNEFRHLAAQDAGWEVRRDGLDRVERAVGVAGQGGVADALGEFYDALAQLADNPDSMPHRAGVRAAAQTLTDLLRQAASSLDEAVATASDQLTDEVATIDPLAEQIEEVNIRIGIARRAGANTADLEDIRDSLIDELAAQGPVTTATDSWGRMTVTFGTQTLVDATTGVVGPFTVTAGGTFQINGAATTLSSGRLEALLAVRDTIVGGATGERARLDQFAQALISRTNAVHATGFGLDGVNGRNLLAGTGAADINVDATVLASLDAIATAASVAELPGGATAGRALVATRDATGLLFGATQSLEEGWQMFSTELGAQTKRAQDMARVNATSLRAVDNRRTEASGVNVDEEIAQMLRYRKTYDAAATMINVMDGLIGRLIDVVR